MSKAKNRYNRRIEILDFSGKPLTRYARFDRGLTTVLKRVLAGSELKVEACGKRLKISLGSEGVWEFPTIETGLRSIGDILEGNIGAITTIEGEFPAVDPIDKELLTGSTLCVSGFNGKVKVCWIRELPSEEIKLKSGGSHRVIQKGVRTLIQDEGRILNLIRDTLEVSERVDKVSTLPVRSE